MSTENSGLRPHDATHASAVDAHDVRTSSTDGVVSWDAPASTGGYEDPGTNSGAPSCPVCGQLVYRDWINYAPGTGGTGPVVRHTATGRVACGGAR